MRDLWAAGAFMAALASAGAAEAAEECAGLVSRSCLEAFAAGAIPAPPDASAADCSSQMSAYRACLGRAVARAGSPRLREALDKLTPDGVRQLTFAYAASVLGPPMEDYGSQQAFELDGYRIQLFGDNTTSFHTLEYGPTPGALVVGTAEARFEFPYVEDYAVLFGETTLAEFSGGCEVSDFNYEARGRCMNGLEIECGGYPVVNGLYFRAGIQTCNFETVNSSEDLGAVFWGEAAQTLTDRYEGAEAPILKRLKPNYVAVSSKARDCSRPGC